MKLIQRERAGQEKNVQKKILGFMEEQQMIGQGDRLVLGVSGGADSVCLLHIFLRIQTAFGLQLYVVHVNHGLRGEEAQRDENFVTELCEKYGIPCRVVRLDIREEARSLGCSEEEAGRIMRYRIFAEEAKRQDCTKVAVAHHMEDNAETLLFRMFRGTGVTGLAGIAPVSSLMTEETITVIRPLLCVTRAQVEGYLQENGLTYCTDSTNADTGYSRNRIRNEILPVAGMYINPQTVRNLNALAQHARKVSDYLERQAEELYHKIATQAENRIVLALQGTEEPVLVELVFRKALYELSGKRKDITAVHIEALCGLLDKQVGSSLNLPYGIRAKKNYNGILLQTEDAEENPAETTVCTVQTEAGELLQGATVVLPENHGSLSFSVKEIEEFGPEPLNEIIKITQNDYTKCFDYDTITDNISVRVAKDTDWLYIHPDGRKKELKDYFVDAKVPQEERKQLYLVAEADKVLWIPGRRTGEHRRVSQNTKKVLLIEWNI